MVSKRSRGAPASQASLCRLAVRSCLTLLSMGGVSGLASAQEQQGSTASSPQQTQVEEVTVTGSRIKRTTDFNTPTPTTVIDTSTMESMGLVNVGAAAMLAPANVSTFTPANTGNSNFFTGAYIADLRGLNPYFGSRTLVLIDGERVVQTEQGDQFDLNFLPQILVSRIDTVTGGASAAYGSGAIAGVENVILDNKLEGGKVAGDFYDTQKGDGQDRHIGAAYGHGFLDNKWHFVVGAEYEDSDPVACINRSWCKAGEGFYETGTTPAANGSQDILQAGTNLRGGYLTTPGVVLPASAIGVGPASPMGLNAAGTGLSPFSQPVTPASFLDPAPGGGGIPIYNQFTNLSAPVQRTVAMGMLTGEVNDYLNVKASYLFGRVLTTDIDTGPSEFAIPLMSSNPYLATNPALQSLATSSGGEVFLNKSFSDQVPSETDFTTQMQRFTVGLDGKFGSSSWTWDVNYEYGLTRHDQLVTDNLSLYRVQMALDPIIGTNGQLECRVSQPGGLSAALAQNPAAGYAVADPRLANGCVPINPLGTGQLTQAQLNYAFPNLLEQLRYEQTDVTVNASGNYFDGVGAGAWSLAVGYEWRQERGDNIDQPGQPTYMADDFQTQYGSSFGGIVTVNEGYLETNIPLLKDRPGAHLLEFNIAGRESAYENRALYGVDVCGTPGSNGCPQFAAPPGTSFSHTFPTFKVSGIYEPVEGVRLRASQSRDERAPNFRELYYNQVIGQGGLFGQCGPAGSTIDPCTWNLLGNPNLKPETSDTTTVGIVLTPLPGLQFSADYFHIKISDAIEQANPVLVEDGCQAGVAQYCQQVTFNNNVYDAGGNLVQARPGNYSGSCPAGSFCGESAYAITPGHTNVYNLTEIEPTSYNGAFYIVSGIDFSLTDTLDFGRGGTLTTRLLATWTGQQTFSAACIPNVYCPVLSILGQTGSGNSFLPDYVPDARWRGSALITWSKGPLSVTPNMEFVSGGSGDYIGVTPSSPIYNQLTTGALPYPYNTDDLHPLSQNHVPAYFVFGLNGTYSFDHVPALKGLQVFVQIDNIFNKLPPFADGGGDFGPSNGYGGTNPIFFDTFGRAFRGGFRLSF